MATKAQLVLDFNAGKGCIARLKDDEEAFILQSGDIFAAEVVGAWAHAVRSAADALPDEHADKAALREKANNALDWANRSLNYAGRKIPATPLGS